MSLRNALGYPDNVPSLLLLEAHVGVEHSKVELLHEGTHVDLDLMVGEGGRKGRAIGRNDICGQ